MECGEKLTSSFPNPELIIPLNSTLRSLTVGSCCVTHLAAEQLQPLCDNSDLMLIGGEKTSDQRNQIPKGASREIKLSFFLSML